MKSQNIFSDLPHCPKNEIFDSLIKNESITIERIVSKGHRSPENGWYDQDKNEWILVLNLITVMLERYTFSMTGIILVKIFAFLNWKNP